MVFTNAVREYICSNQILAPIYGQVARWELISLATLSYKPSIECCIDE